MSAPPTVTVVDSGPHCVSRRVTVAAPVADIFALVADPHRHPEIDGSGTVRPSPVKGPARLGPGATFSVGMKQYGVPYTIRSRVTAFEDDRLIEWRHPAGHRWRWEFAPTESGTDVTESFDYSFVAVPRLIELFGFPRANADGITKTLQALAQRF